MMNEFLNEVKKVMARIEDLAGMAVDDPNIAEWLFESVCEADEDNDMVFNILALIGKYFEKN